MAYRVWIRVKEVRGSCAIGYEPDEHFLIEKYYIRDVGRGFCMHALASMLTLLSPLLKGVSARILCIGGEDSTVYEQCPDPGNSIHVVEQ